MIPQAIRLGALSVDHLEASSAGDLEMLAASSTFGVILPCCGLHTDGRYARARSFIDAGGALAIATNCNPGSAPIHSMPLAIALAVRFCSVSVAEAIAACTVNACTLLGLSDRGTIAPGQLADLLLLRHRDERQLACQLGGRHIDLAIKAGNIVRAPAPIR
jgi:imidazolonepropionase